MTAVNIEYMKKALECAKNSGIDIPAGAVIVKNGEIISCAANEREKTNRTAAHAEMTAVERAEAKLGRRLNECEMYATLEPCPMCAAAILYSGIKAVYFGAYDALYGALGSKIDMRQITGIKMDVKGGIMEEESSMLLKEYFKKYIRKKKHA